MEKFKTDVEAANALHESYGNILAEIKKVIIGQDDVIHLLLTAIFCQGHCLLVGVPGLAKTLLIQTIASSLELKFNRIQFTPDLMPSDILGSETLDKERNFQFIKGPVFANIILADVTISGKKYDLQRPFFVLATQNPIEQEGTYPLPEAQLDRFMFNVFLDYPAYQSEIEIVKATTSDIKPIVEKVLSGEEIQEFQHLVRRVPVTDNVVEYAVQLVHKTRPNTEKSSSDADEYLEWGAGPRASQALILGAKCNAILKGKYSPDIEDIKSIALPVLRHRIVRNFKAEAEGITVDDIVRKLL